MSTRSYSKKEIIYVHPLHTAKTLVLVYLSLSIPIVLLALFITFIRDEQLPGLTILSVMALNALVGFSLLLLGCTVYNWVARKFGGIEVAIQEINIPKK